MVGEAVQLNLRKLFDSQGNIVAQLAQRRRQLSAMNCEGSKPRPNTRPP